MQVTFALPKNMEPERAANTLAAYLLGWRALTNPRDATGQHKFGPYAQEPGHWQLDPSNDYFLTIEGAKIRLSCRYTTQAVVIDAMKAMFTYRFFGNDAVSTG